MSLNFTDKHKSVEVEQNTFVAVLCPPMLHVQMQSISDS